MSLSQLITAGAGLVGGAGGRSLLDLLTSRRSRRTDALKTAIETITLATEEIAKLRTELTVAHEQIEELRDEVRMLRDELAQRGNQ